MPTACVTPRTLAPLLAGAWLLAACGGEPARPASPGSALTTASAPSPASPAAPAPVAVGPGASPTGAPSASPAPSGPSFPRKPAPILPQHGQDVWAVYLATFPEGGDAWTRAAAAWQATGLPISSGELGCDKGAKEAGISGAFGVAVYFATEADANAFAAGTTPHPAGVAKITILCAD